MVSLEVSLPGVLVNSRACFQSHNGSAHGIWRRRGMNILDTNFGDYGAAMIGQVTKVAEVVDITPRRVIAVIKVRGVSLVYRAWIRMRLHS